jgi:hypothetical protein
MQKCRLERQEMKTDSKPERYADPHPHAAWTVWPSPGGNNPCQPGSSFDRLLIVGVLEQAMLWLLFAAVLVIVFAWEREPLASLWLRPFEWQSFAWAAGRRRHHRTGVALLATMIAPAAIDAWDCSSRPAFPNGGRREVVVALAPGVTAASRPLADGWVMVTLRACGLPLAWPPTAAGVGPDVGRRHLRVNGPRARPAACPPSAPAARPSAVPDPGCGERSIRSTTLSRPFLPLQRGLLLRRFASMIFIRLARFRPCTCPGPLANQRLNQLWPSSSCSRNFR